MDNEELTELFKRIEKQVITILTNTKYGTPLKLKKDIDITVRSAVRTAYDSAKGLIDTAVIGSNAAPTRILLPGIIAASTKDVKSVARWELAGHYSGIADNVQRQINDTINELNKTGSATVVQVQSALIKKFEEDGVLNVEYKGGRSVKASKYAEMVSRTARVECENLRGIATAEKIGTDIVEIIGNDNTCSVCAKYRDRWYSISGKSTEYPALYETALSKGYNVIHPNCRCTVNPISLKFYNDEEIAAMKAKSNAPFEDDRSARQKAEYDKWQFNNRRDWQELQDFQEMKAQLGDKAPYKTLGGYRRAVRQEEKPLNLKKLIYHDKDVKQLEEFKTMLVDNIPYDLDKFQEMKYTNVDKYEELKDYSKSIQAGKLSSLVDFNLYQNMKKQIANQIIGLTTVNGIKIASQSKHFVERVLGSVEQKRNGVSVENVRECINHGVAVGGIKYTNSSQSQLFELASVCQISINPITGNLIQVNPITNKEKMK